VGRIDEQDVARFEFSENRQGHILNALRSQLEPGTIFGPNEFEQEFGMGINEGQARVESQRLTGVQDDTTGHAASHLDEARRLQMPDHGMEREPILKMKRIIGSKVSGVGIVTTLDGRLCVVGREFAQ
jgi:hypothetical protein